MIEQKSKGDSGAKRFYSFKRLFSKLLGFFAESMPFLPGKVRAKIHKIRGVNFSDVSTVFIGRNVYLDDMYPELISIGKGVFITNGAKILTHFLNGRKRSNDPGEFFDFYKGQVIIGDNVFIGSGSIITKPVEIGAGAIIGANAVISKNVPPNAIMVGNPAKNVAS